MDDLLPAFFDELEKISMIAHSISGSTSGVMAKPGEARMPMSPPKIKPKVINPSGGGGLKNTNYTRSNVEAPGTDVGINMAQKVITPPPVRV
jgi:hypothetical protein